MDRRRVHRSLENRADAVSHTAHRHHCLVNEKNEDQNTTDPLSLEDEHSITLPELSVASLRSRCRGPRDHDDVDGLITMRRTN